MELDGVPIVMDDALPLALYNYGHFTSMLVDDLAVKGLPLHLERLIRDCRILFGAGLDPAEARRLVRQFASGLPGPGVVRVTVYDPSLDLGSPDRSSAPRILVTGRPHGGTHLAPLRVMTAPYARELPHVKHTGLFGTIYQRRQARLQGHDDVIFTDPDGQISEGATWNVGFWDGRQVTWPKAPSLAGVAMHLVREVITDLGIPAADACIDVPQAQESVLAFATNAVVGIRPITAINETKLPGDPDFLRAIQTAYAAIPATPL